MNVDLIISLVIVGLSGFVLHLKSHTKFIALGLFMGLVLAETVAQPILSYGSTQLSQLHGANTLNIIQELLLLLPALILGFNHTMDKKGFGLVKTVVYVGVTTLFLLASVLSFLPNGLVQTIQNRSVLAFELVQLRNWIVAGTAIMLVADSFHHKQKSWIKKAKSKK